MNQGVIVNLVQIPSVSGNEKMIQKFIEKYLKSMSCVPICVGENLILSIEGHDRTKALIFNTHVDTVHPGESSLWNHHSLSAKIIGDKVYGLGASDEKAAVAACLGLIASLHTKKPACDVWFMFVVREELDGSGTQEAMKWFVKNYKNQYQSISGILGEPTDLTKLEIGHKGNVFLKLTTYGDSGHGSQPQEIKKHAIMEMYKVAKRLDILGKAWKDRYADQSLGKPTIGLLTSIAGGQTSSPNKFPDSCSATFDIRTTPLLHMRALDEVKKAVGRGVLVELIYEPVLWGKTAKEAEIMSIVKSVSGAKITVSETSNDLCFFSAAKIPAVVFGPGTKAAIHKPNEYCLLANIQKCLEIYMKIIDSYGSSDLALLSLSQGWKLDWSKFRQYLTNKYTLGKAFIGEFFETKKDWHSRSVETLG